MTGQFLPAHRVLEPAGEAHRTVLFLHGILGSQSNWKSFASGLQQRVSNLRVVLCDHRNHGDSQNAAPPHSLSACAQDLQRLESFLGTRFDIIIGHSFGGKVALQLSANTKPDQTWILDSPTRARLPEPNTHPVDQVIASIKTLPVPAHSRAEAIEFFVEQGLPKPLSSWLCTNLVRTNMGFVWRFELDSIEEMLASYYAADLTPLLQTATPEKPIHIVRAEQSDRWVAADHRALTQMPAGVNVHVLSNAGHWLHVDNPSGLMALFVKYL